MRACAVALATIIATSANAWTLRTLTGKVTLPNGTTVTSGRVEATATDTLPTDATGGLLVPIAQVYPVVAGVLTCSGGCSIVSPATYDWVVYQTRGGRQVPVLSFTADVGEAAGSISLMDIYTNAAGVVTATVCMRPGDDAADMGSDAATDNYVLTADGLGGAAWEAVAAGTADIEGVTAGNGLTGGGESGTVTLNVGAGTGISVAADTVGIADTSVTPGSYTFSSITVDQQGRITAASSGTETGDISGVTAGDGLTGGGTSGTVSLAVGAGTGITVAADTVSATLGTTIGSAEIEDGACLAEILDDDGTGSLLDADTLDGVDSTGFLTAEAQTLAAVTALGASTTDAVSLQGGLTLDSTPDSGIYNSATGVTRVSSGGANLGSLQAGKLTLTSLGTGGSITVTPQGTPGSTTWSYRLVPIMGDGTEGKAGATSSTTTGNATLNGSNFNRLTWGAVTAAYGYNVYRVTAGGTPSSTGKINTSAITALMFDDTGLAGDSVVAPTLVDATGRLVLPDGVGTLNNVSLQLGQADTGLYSSSGTITIASNSSTTCTIKNALIACTEIGSLSTTRGLLEAGSGVTEDADGYARTWTWKGTIVYGFWTDADTDQTKTLMTLPANTRLHYITLLLVTAPTGAGCSSVKISVGTTGDADVDTLIVDTETFGIAAGTEWGNADGDRGTDLPDADVWGAKKFSRTSTQQIDVELETVGCNVNALATGSWSVTLDYTVEP